jgi:CRISPR system Cascade subunit CasE
MSLFMLQMQPDMPRLIRWAKAQNLLPQAADDDLGYVIHALLAANFNDLAPRPFCFQRNPGRPAQLLAYAAQDAATLQAQAQAFALPEAIAAIGLETLQSKPMPAAFAVGRSLGFTVRVRPTIRTDKAGDRSRIREIDAFQAAIENAPENSGVLRADVYRDWLTSRLLDGGCNVCPPLALSALQRTPVFRRGLDRRLRRLGGPEGGPDATYSGTITITDSEKFSALLTRGVGRHRAFGFGMLLLRPV